MKLTTTYIILAILLSSSVALVAGDVGNPQIPYLEINGAKIVSEGGFFWFEVRNNAHYWIEVHVSYSTAFKICLFNDSRPLHGMGVVVTESIYDYPLDVNQTLCVGFVAPFLQGNVSFQSYLFTFTSGIGGISTEKAVDTEYYSVLIVKSVINLMQITPSKLNDLLSNYAKLVDNYNVLKQEYQMLWNNQQALVESLGGNTMSWIFIHGFLLSVTFTILAYSIIRAFETERKMKKLTRSEN
jgi:hypothetical protein